MERDAADTVSMLSKVEESQLEQHRLKMKRADLLAVGFQSSGAENQEFASLVMCATAGIFAVSVHYGFFGAFAFSYWLYRGSTKAVRIQRNSAEVLQETIDRMRELEQDNVEHLAALRLRAAAWAGGGSEADTQPE